MSESIIVLNIEDAEKTANRIIKMMDGKVCDIVSCHSAHYGDMKVLEEVSLKDTKPIIHNGLVKIPLDPRRNLSLDIKDAPVVVFVSDRRVDIVRKLSDRDTVTRIVLINKTC